MQALKNESVSYGLLRRSARAKDSTKVKFIKNTTQFQSSKVLLVRRRASQRTFFRSPQPLRNSDNHSHTHQSCCLQHSCLVVSDPRILFSPFKTIKMQSFCNSASSTATNSPASCPAAPVQHAGALPWGLQSNSLLLAQVEDMLISPRTVDTHSPHYRPFVQAQQNDLPVETDVCSKRDQSRAKPRFSTSSLPDIDW
jgi:hypothetical protein